MGVRIIELEAVVTGADGSATGSGKSSRIAEGEIEAVYVAYNTQPSTCDAVLSCTMNGAPDLVVLTLTDKNADGWFYPVAQAQKLDGTAITGWYDELSVNGQLKLSVAGGNAGKVQVWVVVSC